MPPTPVRDARQAGEHCLHQRLRHTLVAVGGQREDIERLEPRRHVHLVADENHSLLQVLFDDQVLQDRAHRSIADHDQVRLRRQRLDQEAMPLADAQPGDDADELPIARQVEERARRAAVAGAEARRVDPGRHRVDALRGEAVALDEVLLQRLAGGHDARRGARIQPARWGVARHRGGAVAGAHGRHRPAHGEQRQRRKPGVGRRCAWRRGRSGCA